MDAAPSKVIIITGPTAVGKSRVGHQLARELGGEVINADSLQIYRYLDIGTAKPGLEERSEIPYHLIDIRTPDQSFNAADFRTLALETLADLSRRGKPVLVVGGTGLYLRVLQRGLFPCPPTARLLREKWEQQAREKGVPGLWEILRQVDPESAGRIHPRDRVRVVRALEVLEATGRPLSAWQQWGRTKEGPHRFLWIGLREERRRLYERIDRRTEEMIRSGFLEEVRNLLDRGYGPELPAMQSLGYRHLIRVVRGEGELAPAVELLKRDTRRYAKRQFTWLAKEPDLNWFFPEEFDSIRNEVFRFLMS